jgi:DNA gyrase subunit A
VSGISSIGRNTQGVKIVALDEGDKVVSVAPIPSDRDDEGEGEPSPEDNGDAGDEPSAAPDDEGVEV